MAEIITMPRLSDTMTEGVDFYLLVSLSLRDMFAISAAAKPPLGPGLCV